MYSLVVVSTFTLLYNYHHCLSPALFHYPKLKLCNHEISISQPVIPQPLATTTSFSVAMNLITVGILYDYMFVTYFCLPIDLLVDTWDP